MTERYDPDAEIVARAMAEIAEACKPAATRVMQLQRYHSTSPGAEARRVLLRARADQHRAAFMGEPPPPQQQPETQRAAEPASPTARVDEDALI